VGDDPADPNPPTRLHPRELVDRYRPQGVELVPDETGRVTLRRQPGRPHIRDETVDRRHPGQRRCDRAGHGTGQTVGAVLGRRPGGPERLSSGHTEAREGIRGGERLQLCGGETGTPGQIRHILIQPMRRPLGHDPLGHLRTEGTHAVQPEPDRRTAKPPRVRRLPRLAPPPSVRGGLQDRSGTAGVDVWPADLHPVPAGVIDQSLRRVEPHRLGIEQRGQERCRVVPLEPGTGVDQVSKAHRVALRETVAGERGELAVDVVSQLTGDTPLGHTGVEPVGDPGHPLHRPLCPHRPTQLIRLGRVEAGQVDGELHELLLEQRHAQGLLQRVAHQRMGVGDRLLAVLTPDVRMHRAALDRAGPDQRHLHHQVVEAAGSEPGQGSHLGTALHLEHPDRVRPAEHVVDLGIVQGHVAQLEPGPDHVVAVVQRGEHAETEQVELDQPDGGTVVLVPLEHAPAGHPPPLHRAHLDHRTVADHHAAGVDAQMPREGLHRVGVRHHRFGNALGIDLGNRAPPVDLLAPGVLLTRGEPERLRHVPHRRPGPIRDDVGDLGGVLPPVPGVDVLDDLLPAVGLDVHVDVRRPVPLRGEEALEEQPMTDRVDVGDPQGVADRRVRRRPPTLAVDVLLTAERDDVVDHQEVAGKAQLLDHVQLVLQLRVRLGVRLRRAVAFSCPPRREVTQPAHLGVPGRNRIGR